MSFYRTPLKNPIFQISVAKMGNGVRTSPDLSLQSPEKTPKKSTGY